MLIRSKHRKLLCGISGHVRQHACVVRLVLLQDDLAIEARIDIEWWMQLEIVTE